MFEKSEYMEILVNTTMICILCNFIAAFPLLNRFWYMNFNNKKKYIKKPRYHFFSINFPLNTFSKISFYLTHIDTEDTFIILQLICFLIFLHLNGSASFSDNNNAFEISQFIYRVEEFIYNYIEIGIYSILLPNNILI